MSNTVSQHINLSLRYWNPKITTPKSSSHNTQWHGRYSYGNADAFLVENQYLYSTLVLGLMADKDSERAFCLLSLGTQLADSDNATVQQTLSSQQSSEALSSISSLISSLSIPTACGILRFHRRYFNCIIWWTNGRKRPWSSSVHCTAGLFGHKRVGKTTGQRRGRKIRVSARSFMVIKWSKVTKAVNLSTENYIYIHIYNL